MTKQRRWLSASRLRRTLFLVVAAGFLLPRVAAMQGLTGALSGTLSDPQGAALVGASVRASSPALIGRELTTRTNERGQWWFPNLPPGMYVLDIEVPGFQAHRELDIRIGAGATIERLVVLSRRQHDHANFGKFSMQSASIPNGDATIFPRHSIGTIRPGAFPQSSPRPLTSQPRIWSVMSGLAFTGPPGVS